MNLKRATINVISISDLFHNYNLLFRSENISFQHKEKISSHDISYFRSIPGRSCKISSSEHFLNFTFKDKHNEWSLAFSKIHFIFRTVSARHIKNKMPQLKKYFCRSLIYEYYLCFRV